ncbi:hypothetical protein ACVWXO_001216 [Bradyrhizobium sp. LM2.7]
MRFSRTAFSVTIRRSYLQDLDQSALLGEFVFPGRQLLGDDPAIAGATQLVDHRTMIGVDRVAADTRLTCERGNKVKR